VILSKRHCSSNLLALTLLGCGQPIDLGNQVIWHADHESGDTSEWEATSMFGGSSTMNATVTDEQAHSGDYSLALVAPGTEAFGAGFDFNTEAEAYFSAWFYVPAAYAGVAEWSFLGFASRGEGCTGPESTCAGVDVRMRSLPTGELLLYLFNSEPDVLQPPLSDPPTYLPIGRWFQLEVFYRRATEHSGRFHLWLDGAPIFRFDGWRTAEFDNLFVAFGAPPQLDGEVPVLFVDDVAISHIAVTPNGTLE
jgi:hypothetical protein